MSIPNGRYQARAIGAVLGQSKGGKDLLEVLWEIIEGPEEGGQVTSQSYFTGGAKPITIEMMRHIGWTDGADLDSIRGTATISIYDEEYQGQINQKVRVFVPRAGGFQTPEGKRKSPEAAKAFLSRLTGGNSGDAFDAPDMPGDDAAPGTTDSDGLPF